MKIISKLLSLFLILSLLSCNSMPWTTQTSQTQTSSDNKTGTDGSGMSLAILAPQATGLTENQSYLPALVQGEFVSNFSSFSAISVLDRERLDDQYTELLSGYYDDSAQAGFDLGRLTPTTHIMGGSITRTETGYALQMQITKLNANITSGNMGDNIRGDMAWRDEWVARLRETEQFLDSFNRTESMPYTLFYLSNEIKQEGTSNYNNRTVTLSVETHLHGSGIWTVSIERALQAVYDGLDATKRKDAWGLANWPQRGVTNLNAVAERRQNFTVVFELLNSQNKVIGTQPLQVGGSWGLNWSGRPTVNVNADVTRTLNFQNVSADDITDSMTIRVAAVNGIDAETAARNGVLQIRAITKSEFDKDSSSFRFVKGEIQSFADRNARTTNLVIPGTIWGEPVVSIRGEAFKNTGLTSATIPSSVTSIGTGAFMNNSLTSIVIPNSVTSIGAEAFRDNSLTSVVIPNGVTSISEGAFRGNNNLNSVVIPDSVTSIGAGAFRGNSLTSVVIPNSVTSIGAEAFYKHEERDRPGMSLTSIAIGENVAIAANSFGHSWRYYNSSGTLDEGTNHSFANYYAQNGRKAGLYSYVSGKWVYDTLGSNESVTEAKKKAKFWSILGGLVLLGGITTFLLLRPPSSDSMGL